MVFDTVPMSVMMVVVIGVRVMVIMMMFVMFCQNDSDYT